MRTVWKFTFPRPLGEPLVITAINPNVIHVGIDGHQRPERSRHVGSCVTRDSAFVWHVYQLEIA